MSNPGKTPMCDTPAKAADYWRLHIPAHPHFNPDCECCVVLMLNTRRKVKGHYMVATGTQDTLLIHPREVFSTGDYDLCRWPCSHAQPPKRRASSIGSRY